MKIRIKFPSTGQRNEANSAPKSFQQQSVSSCFDGKNMKTTIKIPYQGQRKNPNPAPQSLSSYFDGKKTPSGAHKRKPEGVIEGGGLPEKRRKMDPSLTLQCSSLLKALMKHPAAGMVFNAKTLNISERMKNPMDLGTIESKLAKNSYIGIEEFAADIRLTISNAMLHCPVNNNVHKMAKEINEFFEGRLKSLEENWNHQENLKAGDGEIMSMQLKDANGSRKSSKTQPDQNSFLPKKSEASKSEEKVVKVALDAAVEVEHPKPAQSCVSKLARRNLQKGTSSGSIGGGRAHGSINAKLPLTQGACKRSSCGSIRCHCSLPIDSTHTSSRPVTSEKSLGGDPRVSTIGASKLDSQAKCKLTSEMGKSDPDSTAVVSALDKQKVCCSSHLATPTIDATSAEGLLPAPIFDVQMSPKKALRVAMLKSHFADTIFKAQQKLLLVQGDKVDLVNMLQEKEKLERRQREEKAKIEAQIRAEEAASKMKTELELKRQREAARIALQKMENTAGIELNLEIQKELEILSGCSLSRGNSLHKLGLIIKDEYLEDEEDEAVLTEDVEEAKIEAQIRAKESAPKMKADIELKKQREVTRIALQKMENTAGIELNLEIQKELEILSGCSLSRGPLHKLGLLFKNEYLEDNEDESILTEDVEEAKIEAQIRAAKATSKTWAEVQLKRQREAAQIALKKMENTAGIELNLEIQKELEILSGCSLSRGNPLHKLGLFFKNKYLEDNKDESTLTEDVEEAKIEAQIRAAEATSKTRAEVQLKRQREAAQIALQKMENTAGIELNLEIQKELEILSGCSLSRGNPLHKLGLFFKNEYLEDNEDESIPTEDVEEAKIEAQIRTAEAPSKKRTEVQLKSQREAAQIALQKMEKTAGIEMNLEIQRELEILSGCSPSRGNPLHQLGLFIKDEYLEDKEDEAVLNEDVEDGVMLS